MGSETALIRTSFVIIPARIMTVCSIKHTFTDENGERRTVKVGWQVSCLTCHKEWTLMVHQHREAIGLTRTHSCYAKKGKKGKKV